MALNRSTIRTDIAYLSRRVKPAARAETSAPATSVRAAAPPPSPISPAAGPTTPAAAPSLSLSRSPAPTPPAATSTANPSAAARPTAEARPTRLFPAPGIGDTRRLDAQTPMIRLDPRQSAIGSLLVTGATSAAWESSERVTGAMTVDGAVSGTSVRCSGNRPLVGYVDGTAVVALRHIRELRRALFVAPYAAPLTVEIFDGGTVTLPAAEGEPRYILSLAAIDGVIELRAEPVPATADAAVLWQEFGFSMTTQAAARRQGR
ncbi:FAD-dependent oxidoreductase [Pseudarthrobacter sp. SSS035]|uniref:FAD-dependent oxidoreductase n=1 Tax=Pseudarthrobacter sp. SSS035 TaxID=2931399 RepID=UPI00200D9292|nr:FAD-dependent oxidoreductase [Pseudarthrobacter sp. SSS035]